MRLLSVAAAVAAVTGGTTVLSYQGAAMVHLLAYGTLLGSLVFNTFVVRSPRWGKGRGRAWCGNRVLNNLMVRNP